MKIAVISDIHANVLALEAVLDDIASRDVDVTINLGDCVSGPLWPRETIELLFSLTLPTVRGNHDRWMVEEGDTYAVDEFARNALSFEQRAALHALPISIDVTDDILAIHGTPNDDSAFLADDVRFDEIVPTSRLLLIDRLGSAISRSVILCGHSHRQSLIQVPDGPLILNPGSVGCPVFADLANANRLSFCSPHARYAVLSNVRGRWRAELLALDYDWDAAAARANANGFPEWSQAFRTGSVAA
jgi:predicted phosphodiesterase